MEVPARFLSGFALLGSIWLFWFLIMLESFKVRARLFEIGGFVDGQLPIQVTTSRVNQFDAARLDVEMSAMLKEQLVKVFSLMKVTLGILNLGCWWVSVRAWLVTLVFSSFSGISQGFYFNTSQNWMLSLSF